MESNTTMTCLSFRAVVARGAAPAGTRPRNGGGAGVRINTPRPHVYQGTAMSAVTGSWIADRTPKTIALLPTSDVVEFADVAGTRSWSPPV